MAFNRLKNILGLSLSLAKANFKLKNEGSYLGIFWYLLEPLLLFLIILFIQPLFTQGSIQNYPIYLLLGLIMFNFFSQSTTLAITSITSKSKFVKNIKVRYESLILASFIHSLYSHFFEIIILTLFLVIYGYAFGIFYYVFIFIFLAIFSLGLSFILAILGVYITDLQNVWRVFMRLLWFATPIFYFIKKNSLIFSFNPLFYFLDSCRNLIFGNTINLVQICVLIILSLISLAIGLIIFIKYNRRIAEYI